MAQAEYGSLPFKEAIEFLRQKINLPTERWTDVTGAMHSRAFVVAGANRSDLLCDLHDAINRGIEGKITLQQFRKDFDGFAKKYGWSYKGNLGWRSAIVFQTNLATAYAAGHEEQRRDPDVLKEYPYDRYRTMDDGRVRPLHASWNNIVLPADDPWWREHTPPNGWGCRCWKEPLTIEQARQLGIAPQAPDNGTYEWKNPSTGQTEQVPNGIDPGWNYNPGMAWGRNMQKQLADEMDSTDWKPLNNWGPEKYGRREVPIDKTETSLLPIAKTESELRDRLRTAIGGDSASFQNPAGETVMINQGMADHILEKPESRWNGREQYFGFLPELVRDPYEIWVGFEQHEKTGAVRIRERYVKMVRAKKDKSLGLVADFTKNQWVGLTFFSGRATNLKNLRIGRLLWGR